MNDSRDNRINYIEIPGKNIQASRTFFESLFGWTFQDWGPDYMSFSDGNLDGGFYQSDSMARTEAGSVLVILYHHDLESVRDRIVGLGGRVIKDIFSFPGGHRFHFADPSDNEFAVWSDT